MGCTVSTGTKDDREPQHSSGHQYPLVQQFAAPSHQLPMPMQQFYGPPKQTEPQYYGIPRQLGNMIDPVEFVRNIELEEAALPMELMNTPTKPALDTDHKDKACVVGNAIQAFTKNLTGQKNSDIKNAMLLAQLAANKKADKHEQTDAWYRHYVSVLEKIGFVIQEFDINRYESSSRTFKMDRAVLDILKAATTKNGMVLANAAIDALGKLPGDDYAVTLFENQSSRLQKGIFQIGVADIADNGDVILSMGAFYFRADRHQTRFLWFTWSSASISLFQGAQTMVLNEQVYGQVRQAVINKLGTRAQVLVASIEID